MKSGLHKKRIIDKNGKRTSVWVGSNFDKKPKKKKADGITKTSSLESDIEYLHKIDTQGKNIKWKDEKGNITDSYVVFAKLWAKEMGAFMEKHGKQKASAFRVYSSLEKRKQSVMGTIKRSPYFKLKNSKGDNKFGQ